MFSNFECLYFQIMLIHYEGNINAKDNDGNTPIHLAAANGHDKVTVQILLTD